MNNVLYSVIIASLVGVGIQAQDAQDIQMMTVVDETMPVEDMLVTSTTDLIDIGLDSDARAEIAKNLHALLANEYTLYTKTYKFHWNVKGPFFGPLHEFFGKQYDQLAGFVDELAERSLMLGVDAPGTLAELKDLATITEEPGVNPDATGMIKQLLQDHQTVIRQMRADIETAASLNDSGTEDMLTGMMEKHEKMTWMLRAHLQ